MPSTFTSEQRRLAGLLYKLVDVLRAEDGFTWQLLVRITTGRVGLMAFDDVHLRLEGVDGDAYSLDVQPGESGPLNLRTDPATVRDIVAGRLTLDRALVEGRVFVRGDLDDLRAVYQLALSILADGPRVPALRRLYESFDATWPKGAWPADPPPLEAQTPRHGNLVERIPESVLRIDVRG